MSEVFHAWKWRGISGDEEHKGTPLPDDLSERILHTRAEPQDADTAFLETFKASHLKALIEKMESNWEESLLRTRVEM